MSDILDAISRRKKAKADAHTSSDLEQFADIVDLMELCAQLEVEQGKIFAALPALKAEFGKEAKEECDRLTARADAIESQIGTIASDLGNVSTATRAEFARLEAAIKAKGTELAEYSKRIEREIPAPVEAKIRALFEAMPVPKDGKAGAPGARGKDASLLTGFKGNWRDDVTYRAGEWFTFRGSSYLVLRDCKGQVPTKITQTGESAFYAVFAMSGAPGLPGSGSGGSGAGLPDQTGNAGKFLTTDGTDPSWAALAGGGDMLGSNNLSDVASAATSFANIKQAATEAASGVVELATSAETTAGLAVQASDTRLSNARTPTAHKTSHENGGADEISVAGLSGELADAQPPKTHAATHVNGTDDIQNATAAQKGLATAAQITKLDGIEALADVTDATNVAAAGALMESALGTGVETALGIAVGSAGAPVVLNGAGGTPSSLTLTNATGLPTGGIVDAAVTLAKMANLAQDQFIGRTTASTGVPETATITAAARTVLDDATVAAMVDTLGGATSTGTGGIARATSPTFVTPILGTPTSGTLTNCTGLPASGIAAGVLGGNITLGETTGQILLDAALSADGKWSGICEVVTAGETLAFGDLVYLKAADSEWYKTDADASATAGPVKIGICVSTGADGGSLTVLLWGKIRVDAWTLTVGAPVYVGLTAGAVAVTETWGTDDVIRVIGYGNTADELFFCPSRDYITYV